MNIRDIFRVAAAKTFSDKTIAIPESVTSYSDGLCQALAKRARAIITLLDSVQLSRSIEVFEVAAVQEIGTQSCTELTGLQLILMKNIAIEGESIRKMLQRVHMKIIHSKKEIRCLKLNKPPHQLRQRRLLKFLSRQ